MANEEKGVYLENLEEYILDEDKIVTYKWLSRTLSVHVNQAKQMLYTFVDTQRKKKAADQLYVTYLLAGVTQEDDVTIHKIQLVPELSLDGAKCHLNPVTSCHVYSVQKSRLKDSNALYMADVDLQQAEILNSNKCSAIKCLSAKLRSQAAMDSLRPEPERPSVPATQANKTSVSNGTSAKTNNGGVASMFAKQQQNTTKKSDGVTQGGASGGKSQSSKQTNKTKAGAKSSGLQSFFGKQEPKPKSAPKPAGGNVDPTESTSQSKKKVTEKEASTRNRKKKVVDSDEEENPLPQQKRRRIRKVSETSSSEEDVEPESPVPSPPPAREPTPPRSPSPLPVEPSQAVGVGKAGAGEKHRGRKRKLVSKTTVNEEGYMVTEKVWEYESVSESEDEKPVSKPDAASKVAPTTKKSVATKTTSPPNKAARKQSSLMSFFKKK